MCCVTYVVVFLLYVYVCVVMFTFSLLCSCFHCFVVEVSLNLPGDHFAAFLSLHSCHRVHVFVVAFTCKDLLNFLLSHHIYHS